MTQICHKVAQKLRSKQEGSKSCTVNDQLFSKINHSMGFAHLNWYVSLLLKSWVTPCPHNPQHELLYHTFGRQSFRRTTANLDLFLRRFNQVQLWVVTEVCLCGQLSKRVQLLKKFIKIAAQWVGRTPSCCQIREMMIVKKIYIFF